MRMHVGMNWLAMEGMGPIAWTRGNRPIDVPMVRHRTERRLTGGIRCIAETDLSEQTLTGDSHAFFCREKDRTVSER